MRVLVLGATGFIGGNIARAALSAGWHVRGFRRDPNSVGFLSKDPVEWTLGDLTDRKSILKAMSGVDIVFHAAAFYPKSGDPQLVPHQIKQASDEIDSVIDAFRRSGAKRFIYTSSLTTIGHPPPDEDRIADERDFYQLGSLPKSGYYESKSVMETRVLESVKQGLDAVVLNPTAVFGPGDIHLSLGKMLIAAAKGQAFFWLPGMVNVVDVRDVASAHITAAQNGTPGHRYILGGHNLTIKQALTLSAKTLGVSPPRLQIPLSFIDLLVSLGDVFPSLPLPANHMRTLRFWQPYNTSKAKTELGLNPRSFESTVSDSINWFRSQGYLL